MSGHTHHAIDYVELAVTDLPAAKRFYAGAFGWEFTDYGPAYAGFRAPGREAESGGLRAHDCVSATSSIVIVSSLRPAAVR